MFVTDVAMVRHSIVFPVVKRRKGLGSPHVHRHHDGFDTVAPISLLRSLDVDNFQFELQSHPDPVFARFFYQGIMVSHFDLGYALSFCGL